MTKFGNRLPTGPGSRGGRWHEKEYRNEYQRAWYAANPEYREREALRRARARAGRNGVTPADIVVPPHYPRPLPSPNSGLACKCGEPGCNCQNTILIIRCDMCMQGLHS
jgi:hypothetical protein